MHSFGNSDASKHKKLLFDLFQSSTLPYSKIEAMNLMARNLTSTAFIAWHTIYNSLENPDSYLEKIYVVAKSCEAYIKSARLAGVKAQTTEEYRQLIRVYLCDLKFISPEQLKKSTFTNDGLDIVILNLCAPILNSSV